MKCLDSVERDVCDIIDRVRQEGDIAVCSLLARFDKVNVRPDEFLLSPKTVREGAARASAAVVHALTVAARNIRAFYRAEKKAIGRSWQYARGGVVIRQVPVPLARVGVYVPGGKFSYPSTVLMGVIPAKVAGVKQVVVASPPGKITADVLAACQIAGVDAIYQIGGPAAIAALALGTTHVPRVDKIVGPGNMYVTAAKRLLFGETGIDMLAGPSEVAIVADRQTRIDEIVADIRAQLEHDKNARAYLIVRAARISDQVRKLLQKDDIERTQFVTVRSAAEAADQINRIAPEHVELLCADSERVARGITSAGVVYVGSCAPVALGDYCIGPSHILPTGSTARFSSGLSTADFIKRINVVRVHKSGYLSLATHARVLAHAEGMVRHAHSVAERIRL